jgi:hypothetical protein
MFYYKNLQKKSSKNLQEISKKSSKNLKKIFKKSAGRCAEVFVLYFYKYIFLNMMLFVLYFILFLYYFLIIYYKSNDNRHDNCFEKILFIYYYFL